MITSITSKEMTEIDTFLLIEVLGYKTIYCHRYPSDDMNDALEVIDKMKELGWWCSIHSPFTEGDNQYVAGFTPLGVTGWNGNPDYKVSSISMPYSIAKAAMLAFKSQKKTKKKSKKKKTKKKSF